MGCLVPSADSSPTTLPQDMMPALQAELLPQLLPPSSMGTGSPYT